jgi:hypothetical protein
MSTRLRFGLVGALVVSAVVGGVLMDAVVSAAIPTPTSAPHAPITSVADGAAVTGAASAAPAAAAVTGKYCDAYRAAFASNLGVSEAKVREAAIAALDTTIDQAVTDGAITQVRGDRLKARVAAAPADLCATIAKRVGNAAAGAKAGLGVIRDGLTAAADALHSTPADLRASLAAGKSLKDLATTAGVPYATVTAAVTSAVKADLDAAVTAGTIKQAREDAVLAGLAARLADGRLRPQP